MKRRKFTKEEVEELSKNIHVSKCSGKAISYSKEFKILAVKRYVEDGLSPAQIFKEAGFEAFGLKKDVANERLFEWRKLYATKGEVGLSLETRGRAKGGGRPRTRGVTDADRIERLEIENVYLKAENAFLAKLRAKRRE